MRPLRLLVGAVVLSLIGISSCTDGETPSEISLQPKVSFSVVPELIQQLATEGSNPINRIRVTARDVQTDSILGQEVVDVDSTAEEWTISVEVVISGAGAQVYLTIELINVTAGVESVEWSGETEPMSVTAGSEQSVQNVGVARGGLDNLTVTSVSIREPIADVAEGDTVRAVATAASTADASAITIFWASLDPAIADVDNSGLITGLLPGAARIVATAGTAADTAEVTVTQRPTGVVLTPDSILLASLEAEVQFEVTVVDARGDSVPGEPVEWGLENAEILAQLGDGLFRAIGVGATVVTATSVNHPDLADASIVVVAQAPAALRFVQQPSDTVAGEIITPAPSVEAVDPGGTRVTGFTEEIGLALSGVGEATLLGSTSRAAVLGIAEFDDLTVDEAGVYTLEATATGLTSATSESFAIASNKVDIALAKTVSKSDISQLVDTVAFTVTVSNTSGYQATNVELKDSLPAGLVYASASATRGTYDALTGIWAIDTIPPSGGDTLWLHAYADAGTAGSTLTNTVSVGSVDQVDTIPGNDMSDAAVTVYPDPVSRSYETVGNTELIAGAYPAPSTPHLVDATNLLAGTPTLTVTSDSTATTANGGTVTMEADGDFTYTPAPGDTGPDSFTYTVHTGASATVAVTMADMVWYVDNSSPTAPGTGVSNDPFLTLQEADLAGSPPAPAPPGRIFLHAGNSATPGSEYEGGITLDTNQIMEGEAVGLTVAPFGTLVPAGASPVVTNTLPGGDGLALGSGSTLRGVTIDSPTGASLHAQEINGSTVEDLVIFGGAGIGLLSTTGNITFTNTSVTDASNTALAVGGGSPIVSYQGTMTQNPGHLHLIRVDSTTGGSVTLTGGPFTDTSSGLSSVVVDGASGPVDVLGTLSISNAGETGILIQNSTTSVSFANATINETNTGAIKITGGPVTVDFNGSITALTRAGRLLDIQDLTAGSSVTTTGGAFNGSDNQGILISNASGPVTVNNPVSQSVSDGPGLTFINSSGDVTFADLDITSSNGVGIDAEFNEGTLTVTSGTINTTNEAGIYVSNAPFNANLDTVTVNNGAGGVGSTVFLENTAPGSVTFGLLDITSNVTTGGLYLQSAGTVSVTDPSSSIVVTDYAAIESNDTDLNMTFASVSVSNPSGNPGHAVYVEGGGGTLTMNGGTISSAVPSVGYAGLSISQGTADIVYGGSIDIDGIGANSVKVVGRTGGSVTVTGAVTDTGDGIYLSNTGGVMSFQGGMSLSGPSSQGFQALGGGEVSVTGTNMVSTTGRTAVTIDGPVIGSSGVTFESVSADGGAYGIYVDGVGVGSFMVTGDGSTPGSGGTIRNSTSTGVHLRQTGNVSLSWVDVSSPVTIGIFADDVDQFTLANAKVDSAGTYGLQWAGIYGTSEITGTSILNSGASNAWVKNIQGTLDLSVATSHFDSAQASGASGFLLETNSAAMVSLSVAGSTFDSNFSNGLVLKTDGTSSIDATVDGTVDPNQFAWNSGGDGIQGNVYGSATLDLTVKGSGLNQNLFDNNNRGVSLIQSGTSSTLYFDIFNNRFKGGDNAARVSVDEAVLATATLEGQILSNNMTDLFSGAAVEVTMAALGQGKVKIADNTIESFSTFGDAISVVVGTAEVGPAGRLDLLLHDNTVTLFSEGGSSVYLATRLDAHLCADLTGNTLSDGPTDFYIQRMGSGDEIWLEDHGNRGSSPPDTAVRNTWLPTDNPGADNNSVSTSDRIQGVYPGTCLAPFTDPPSGTADIEVRKTATPVFGLIGAPFTYTVVVKNRGPATATGIEVFDSVSTGQDYTWSPTPDSWTPVAGTGTGTWSVGSLAPGDSAVMTADDYLPVGTESNFARLLYLTEVDPNPANDTSSVEVNGSPGEIIGEMPESPELAPDRQPFRPDERPEAPKPSDALLPERPWVLARRE